MKHGKEPSAEALKAAERVTEADDQEGLGKLVIKRYDPGWKARLAYWWSETKQHRPSVKVLTIAHLLFWITIALILKFYEA